MLRLKLFILLITAMLLSSPGICFCQQFFLITYGYLDTDSVTAKEFRAQKELKLHNNMQLDSAVVYFHIPGKKMKIVAYRPVFDAANFKKCLLQLVPGSVIGFENIVLIDSNHHRFRPHNLVRYHIVQDDFISTSPAKSGIEISRLGGFAYTSGKIYFKIPGQRPEVLSLDGVKSTAFRNLFNSCTPGSILVFENVYYKNEKDRVTGPLNFTCRLQ